MKRPACQYPVIIAKQVSDTCGKPAKWSTDDLQHVHHLCEEHCAEAMQWNTFRRDEVAS